MSRLGEVVVLSNVQKTTAVKENEKKNQGIYSKQKRMIYLQKQILKKWKEKALPDRKVKIMVRRKLTEVRRVMQK